MMAWPTPAFLCEAWVWVAFADFQRLATRPIVRVFSTRRGADRARRSYGRGAWRAMEIVRVE
jgi:hypothetical protein